MSLLFWIFFTFPIGVEAHAEVLEYDFVVVGAGPAGLFSALEVAKQGYSVLVLEKRTPELENTYLNSGDTNNYWGTRERRVGIDKEAYFYLKKLGMTRENGLTPFLGQYLVDKDGLEFPISSLVQLVVGRQFGGNAAINNIEKFLVNKLVNEGGVVLYGSDIQKISLKTLQLIRTTKSGKTEKVIIRPKKSLIWAAGSLNGLPKTLGFESTEQALNNSQWLVGNFQRKKSISKGGYRIGLPSKDFPFLFAGIIGDETTTIYMATKEPNDLELLNESNFVKAAKQLGIKDSLVGPIDKFDVQWEQASKFTSELENDVSVIIVGDSARKVDPFTGIGVTNAFHDSQLVSQYVVDLNNIGKVFANENFEYGMSQRVIFSYRQREIFGKLKSGNNIVGAISEVVPANVRRLGSLLPIVCRKILGPK